MKKNYSELKNDLLVHLLKTKNTSLLSKRMGYNYDQVGRFVNGSKKFKWNEFVDLCFLVKAPLKLALSYLGLQARSKEDCYSIIAFLKKINSDKTSKFIAKKLSLSEPTFVRYANGKIFPEIEIVFAFLDLVPDRLDWFLAVFQGAKSEEEHLHFAKFPWMPAVANVANLSEFKKLPEHSNQWIADYLGIKEREVEIAFNEFVKMGLIEKTGPHYKLTGSAPKKQTITINGIQNELYNREMVKFLTKKSLQRYSGGIPLDIPINQDEDKCVYRVFSCSEKNISKINEILFRAEEEIHLLLSQASEEKDNVRAILFHHFDLKKKY